MVSACDTACMGGEAGCVAEAGGVVVTGGSVVTVVGVLGRSVLRSEGVAAAVDSLLRLSSLTLLRTTGAVILHTG